MPGYMNLGFLFVCSKPAGSLIIRPARSGVAAPPVTRPDQPTATSTRCCGPRLRVSRLADSEERRMFVEMKRKLSRSRDRLSRTSMRTKYARLTTSIPRGVLWKSRGIFPKTSKSSPGQGQRNVKAPPPLSKDAQQRTKRGFESGRYALFYLVPPFTYLWLSVE